MVRRSVSTPLRSVMLFQKSATMTPTTPNPTLKTRAAWSVSQRSSLARRRSWRQRPSTSPTPNSDSASLHLWKLDNAWDPVGSASLVVSTMNTEVAWELCLCLILTTSAHVSVARQNLWLNKSSSSVRTRTRLSPSVSLRLQPVTVCSVHKRPADPTTCGNKTQRVSHVPILTFNK